LSDENLLGDAECPACQRAGFMRGGEFFDPVLLPHLARLEALGDVSWRVHFHEHAVGRAYSVEMCLQLPYPYRGFLRFDGPSHTDPAEAVTGILAALNTIRRAGE